ncbi:MAG: CoA pyrophosphatase [Anaerolineae bacterium]|nr:CoA pyrophosphatase [Anaerolineae bacterium]
MSVQNLTENFIKSKLSQTHSAEPINEIPPGLLNGKPKAAAVLIPLLQIQSTWHVLYIRRTEAHGDYHSGQVAFPGGRRDPQDPSLEAAALRETQEEIGIDPSAVRILGRLRPFVTISNYQVTPIVGVIPWPYPIKPSEDEVSRVFTIPLEWLMASQNRETLQREIPGQTQPIQVIYFKEYDNEVLWGASARFTVSFLETLSA